MSCPKQLQNGQKVVYSLTTTVEIFLGIVPSMIIFGQHGMNKYTRNVIGYSYLLTTIKPMLSVQRVCETFGPFQHYLRNVVLFFWLLREM